MNKTVLTGAALVTALVATPALARHDEFYDYATVIETRPIFRTIEVSTPREECWLQEVDYPRDRKYHDRGNDKGHEVSTVVGGVIGGALGHAVGYKKRNKQVGTVVGAFLGATLGNAISRSAAAEGRYEDAWYGHGDRGKRVRREEVCEIVYESRKEEQLTGYTVRYRYQNETFTTRMDRDPGDTIKVRLALSPVI